MITAAAMVAIGAKIHSHKPSNNRRAYEFKTTSVNDINGAGRSVGSVSDIVYSLEKSITWPAPAAITLASPDGKCLPCRAASTARLGRSLSDRAGRSALQT